MNNFLICLPALAICDSVLFLISSCGATMNLSSFSLTDLRNLQNQVSKQLEVTAQQDIAKAREEIQAIARSVGIPLEELVKGAVDKKSGKVAVQFRNPANAEEQWTGRGRQPKWVKEWMEAGKALDALRV
jgi:DNA-binding protein H-NS